MSLRILRNPAEMRHWRSELGSGSPVGFVPTMGALHAGHAALIRRARQECSKVVVSIFVNPTQFNDPKDFQAYPLTWEADRALCEAVGTDAVFFPTYADLYPEGYRYRVTENCESLLREGSSRPGHFDGVLTVVMKLLLIVAADKAYFGEKDWQQLQLVKGMVDAFFVSTQIVAVPTVREGDGLALSSRNVRLSASGRALAGRFPELLKKRDTPEAVAASMREAGLAVDYVEETGGRRLAAVYVDGVRLLDNVSLEELV